MFEKEIDEYVNETLKSIEEKEEKSLKRLKIFSFVVLLVGLEVINILLQMKIEPFIMIIIIDLFVLAVSVAQYKAGIESGCSIEKKFHKLNNQRNEKDEKEGF